jgi:ribosomal-protein-alanine N-acetyltransferase
MSRAVYIETDRLLLGEIIAEDAARMFELDSSPEVHKYLCDRVPETIEDSLKIIGYIRQQYAENGCRRLAMIEKATGDFIGWTGIKLEEQETNVHVDFYDLGYRLIPRYWGRGFATESALASGFDKLGLEVIHGATDARNIASGKVLTKAGLKLIEQFEEDGYLCNWYGLDRADWNGEIQRATFVDPADDRTPRPRVRSW